MKTHKNIFLWAFYDFANSIVSIVFFLYFAQWVVIDQGISDFRFNLTFTISALLLLFTAPLAGFLLDKFWKRITGLRISTVLTVFFYTLCSFFAINSQTDLALIFFTLGLFSYLLSFTFYTPLLPDIAPPGRLGFISGLGISANYLGQFAGLLLALPFSKGILALFGASARAETLLPATLAFFLLALPMLLLFKEPERERIPYSIMAAFRDFLRETRWLLSASGVFLFFASYFLFNDAILTASNNFPIFLQQVWHISDTVKTYLLLCILITSALGGTLSGLVADRFGHKRTLLWILSGWVVLLPIVGLLTDFRVFVIATVLMGFWFGATWAVSRSVMSRVAPLGQHNLAFSYFGLAERASSFVGPLVWGFTVSQLVSIGSERYRIAMLVISAFVVFGVWLLYHVQVAEERH